MNLEFLRPQRLRESSACVALTSALAQKRFFSTYTIAEIWQSNFTIVLAGVTLLALLAGWIGDSVMGILPAWLVTLFAVVAFVAGGYTGLVGAIEQAKEGRLDIDFLMIAAAIGAAAIGEWEEGALLLFLFTLSGGLEEFAMDRTRRAIEALAELRPDTAQVRRDGHAERESRELLDPDGRIHERDQRQKQRRHGREVQGPDRRTQCLCHIDGDKACRRVRQRQEVRDGD